MSEHVLVLLDQLLRSEVTILVEEVDFEDLFTIWSVGISEDIGDQEGEKVSEGSVAKIGAEDIVVIGVEELDRCRGTNREAIPPL